MNYIKQWVTYDKETRRCTRHPWYSASGLLGGKLVGEEDIERAPSNMGIAYWKWEMDAAVMYPKPLHLVVEFLHFLTRYYWKVLKIFYWIGLIDISTKECFRWSDFYRIKSH